MATASYQMLPDVKLLQPFSGAEAQQLVALCPKKVFDIEDMGTKVPSCSNFTTLNPLSFPPFRRLFRGPSTAPCAASAFAPRAGRRACSCRESRTSFCSPSRAQAF